MKAVANDPFKDVNISKIETNDDTVTILPTQEKSILT